MLVRYPISRIKNVAQLQADTTFCGGLPKLPRSHALPACKLCGANLTFFFQAELPVGHPWNGSSFAVFACMECVDEEHLIPPMITGQLKGAAIPAGFLQSYQQNFVVHVFPDHDAVLRDDYTKTYIKFERWDISSPTGDESARSFVGGVPSWLQEDETPDRYGDSTKLCFLMQLEEGFEFPIETGSPHQTTLGLDGKPRSSKTEFYKLFIANRIYFFGTLNEVDHAAVYIITQHS